MAEIYVKVSGRLGKMNDYLRDKPCIMWDYLDDLALEKPEGSREF